MIGKGNPEYWDINFNQGSEVCHPRCAYNLYGEVNSVKKTQL